MSSAQIHGKTGSRYEEILTPAALAFLVDLHQRFNPTRKALLEALLAFDDDLTADFVARVLEDRREQPPVQERDPL